MNDKTINWFNTYFVTSKQSWKNKICVVKGDLHQPAFTNCNTFDYYSCPSVYGSSQYIVANFGKTNWGVMYMNIDENNNKKSLIIFHRIVRIIYTDETINGEPTGKKNVKH